MKTINYPLSASNWSWLLVICLVALVTDHWSLSAKADGTPVREATAAEMILGTVGSPAFATPRRLSGLGVLTNGGSYTLSNANIYATNIVGPYPPYVYGVNSTNFVSLTGSGSASGLVNNKVWGVYAGNITNVSLNGAPFCLTNTSSTSDGNIITNSVAPNGEYAGTAWTIGTWPTIRHWTTQEVFASGAIVTWSNSSTAGTFITTNTSTIYIPNRPIQTNAFVASGWTNNTQYKQRAIITASTTAVLYDTNGFSIMTIGAISTTPFMFTMQPLERLVGTGITGKAVQ